MVEQLSIGGHAQPASVKYGNRARKSQSEPWVHLLVQQDIENLPLLTELASCRFHVEARLKHSQLHRTDDYTPTRHAAQFLIYLAVADRNSAFTGHGEYYWFGIPIYDDRTPLAPGCQAQESGGT